MAISLCCSLEFLLVGDTPNPGFASLFGKKRNSKAKSPRVAAPFLPQNCKVFGQITSWEQLSSLLTSIRAGEGEQDLRSLEEGPWLASQIVHLHSSPRSTEEEVWGGTAMKSTRVCFRKSSTPLLGEEEAHLAPVKCGCGWERVSSCSPFFQSFTDVGSPSAPSPGPHSRIQQ